MAVVLLDGPLGTELAARGVSTRGPAWSARAISEAPDVIAAIHADYAAAGATVHATATFRTRRRTLGPTWRDAVRDAVALTRGAVPADHRVAGSLAPLEDCYRPDLSPPDPGPEHAELAQALAEEGVDLLLVETFPHIGEAVAAVRAARATGLPVWASLTAGFRADLLTPTELADGARRCVDVGAAAVLVNCVPASATLPYVRALAGVGAPFGAYANAGHTDEGIGWVDTDDGPARYARHAATWLDAGATLVGACCGAGPAHVSALAELLSARG